MTTNHLKKIEVSCHLEPRRNIWRMFFSWQLPDGTRDRQSKTTGPPGKGNKKRAEAMMTAYQRELEVT